MTGVGLGSRVRIPWGLDEVEGEVLAVYGEGPSQRVVIQLTEEGSEGEPTTVTIRSEHVRAVGHGEEPSKPSKWIEEARYEYLLRENLEHLVHLIDDRAAPNLAVEVRSSDEVTRGDLAVTRKGRPVLVVEVKKSLSNRRDALSQLYRFMEDLPISTAALIVTDDDAAADSALEGTAERPVHIVRWKGPEDNRRLSRTLRTLLAGRR